MKTTAHSHQSSTTAITTLEIEIEELEQIVAPAGGTGGDPITKIATNHNESFVRDEEFQLDV